MRATEIPWAKLGLGREGSRLAHWCPHVAKHKRPGWGPILQVPLCPNQLAPFTPVGHWPYAKEALIESKTQAINVCPTRGWPIFWAEPLAPL